MTHRILQAVVVAAIAVFVTAAQQGPMRGRNLEDRLYRYWETAVGAHDIGGAFITGSGAAGSTQTHMSANLVAGKHYIFTLFCDVNCTNVELRALDGNTPVMSEADTPMKRDGGAEAEIAFNAPKAGALRLEVKINACSTPSCNYEIGTFVSR